MRSADLTQRGAAALRPFLAAALALLVAACGGGNSTVTTVSGGGTSGGVTGPVVSIDTPGGANTTEIVVDSGPVGFNGSPPVNLPYVTLTLCTPGTTQCVTIDHVFLDTGSIGLRVLKSALTTAKGTVTLPPQTVPGTTASAVECYPFVLGAVWGPLARADLQIGGETAHNLPVQIIDDGATPEFTATQGCLDAAKGAPGGTTGDLMNSQYNLQANGILGVGMIRYDCGQECAVGPYQQTVYYYRCDPATKACSASFIANTSQVQNPVSSFDTYTIDGATGNVSTSYDNNGTIVVLPKIAEFGASLVRGRLVFGIGNKTNNQLATTVQQLNVDTDPGTTVSNPYYLALTTRLNGTDYPNSYIDSGSNGMFFDAPTGSPTISPRCTVGSSVGQDWACPAKTQALSATMTGHLPGQVASFDFSIANANLLFATTNSAFADLAGTSGQSTPGTFVWGLPFFYGRSVYTSIWQQPLATNGPWNAF
jgi:hypothetical protein